MFGKEETKKLRQDFWISFGKSYPRKWVLYDTKIKGFAMKFHFDTSKAMVSMDIETKDLEKRILLWEKLISLKPILKKDYGLNVLFEECTLLENKTEISRVYIVKNEVSIHNKSTWHQTMVFLNENMKKFEAFFIEFKDMLAS